MIGKAKRVQLLAQWLGEAFRELGVLIVVFVPLDLHFEARSYTALKMSLFFAFALFIFLFGVIIGWIGEHG